MALDLATLEPQKISKDLKGKFCLVYGLPGCGKTTLGSMFPKPLIMGFESGTNALNNVYVAPVRSWGDWKNFGSQLCKKPELKDKYETIVIDTADSAWDLCVKFVCGQHGVADLSEIPWGQGYNIAEKEFSGLFRELTYSGYGLLFISHSTEKIVKDREGNEYAQINPALPKKPYDVVNKMVDIIGYINTEVVGEDKGKRFIYFRGNERFFAKSRFKYIEPRVEFSYQNIVDALNTAIDKEVENSGGDFSNEENPYTQLSYEELIEEAKMLWGQVIQKEKLEETNAILAEEFGKPIKFSEIPEEEIDKLHTVIIKIKEIL